MGHLYGDDYLKYTAMRLQELIHEDDLLGRLGGDEFALVASGANAHLLPEIISSFCKAIKNFNLLIRDTEGNVEKNNLHITVSAGIALLDAKAPRIQTAEQLFDRADKALYHAKHNARSRAVVLKANDQYLILDEENHKAV